MPQKGTTKKTAAGGAEARLLDLARKRIAQGETWAEVQNAIFGVDGASQKLFPDAKSRAAFTETSEYAELQQLLAEHLKAAPPPTPGASGKTLVRMPLSLHAALIAEAEREGVSLNQLMLAKLAVPLSAARE